MWKNVALLSRKNGKFLRRQEIRLRNKVKKAFRKQMEWIVKEMKDLPIWPADEAQNRLDRNANEGDIQEFANNIPYKEEVVMSIYSSSSGSMDKGGKTIVSELKLGDFGISWSLANESAIRFLNNRRALELSNRQGTISDTTKTRILEILIDAAKSGQSYQKTAEFIRQQAEEGIFSQARAEMIATREIGVAYEEGKNIPLRDFQIAHPERPVEKFWQTVEDSKVTPTHRQNQDAGWIDFASTFPGTGDLVAPGSDNPNCRCFTKYRIQPPAK